MGSNSINVCLLHNVNREKLFQKVKDPLWKIASLDLQWLMKCFLHFFANTTPQIHSFAYRLSEDHRCATYGQ